MVQTNEFERDLTDQTQLKRPGRVDMVVFQNIPDAGDGSPGIQRCFRNYLHEGGFENDLNLLGFSIIGTSVNINNAEMQQLSNIGSAEISGIQWGYLGNSDQDVRIADSPTFGGLTIDGAITVNGNVDGVDVSDFKSNYDTHKASTGADHTYINQSVVSSVSPTFVGLTLSADIVTTSTVDGIDVANHNHSGGATGGDVAHSSTSGRTNNDHHPQSHTLSSHSSRAHGELSDAPTSAHHVKTVNTWRDISSLQEVFNEGKTITSANSEANGFKVGGGGSNADITIWGSSQSAYIKSDENLQLGYGGGGTGRDINFYNDGSNNIFAPASGAIHLGNTTYDWKAGYIDTIYYNTIGGSYSHVDDLQLLREAEEHPTEVVDVKDKDGKIIHTMNTWKRDTMPWIKAREDLNGRTHESLKYAASMVEINGYLFSTLKKLLERQDGLVSGITARDLIIEDLQTRIIELEIKTN